MKPSPKKLRAQAEHLLSTTRREVAAMPVEDVQHLVHELQVHQVELEMQNEELRRTQLELEAARERLRLPYDAAPVGFLTLDAKGVIQEANLAAARLLNFDRVKLSGQKLTRFIAPESEDDFYLRRRQLLNTGEKQTCELHLLRTNGPQFIARLEIVVETDGPEPTNRHLVMMSDITEQKQAEAALRESKERLATFAEATFEGIVESEAGRIIDCNEQYARMVGCTVAELKGTEIADSIPPEERERVMTSILQGKEQLVEHPMFCKDGTQIFVEVHGRPIAPGSARRHSSLRDITARKLAEKALRESQERFRVAQELSPDGFTILRPVRDAQNRIVDFTWVYENAAIARLNGTDPQAVLGRRLLELFPGHKGSPFLETYLQVAETGERRVLEAMYHGETIVTPTWFRLAVVSIGGDIAILAQDITARKQDEERLLLLNRTLHAFLASDQALIHATSETEYLAEVCRIIAEDCSHALVWVGFAENDEAKSVRPVASAGFEQGYLDILQISWADTERGRGPTGTAIRTGQVCQCRDMRTDPQFAPWRAEAVKRGYGSSIVFPLLTEGRVFGALTVYGREADAFHADEVQLLTELAGDLAYGITTLRLRAAHTAAEAALFEREEVLRLFVEHAPAGIAMLDTQMRYVAASRRWLADYGLSGQTIVGRNHYDLFPEIPARWREIHRRCLAGAVERADEDQFVRADGGVQWLRWEIHPWKTAADAIGGIIIFSEDITARRQAEQALKKSHAELEQRVRERTEELTWANTALRGEKAFSDNLIELAPALIALVDGQGNLIRTNAYAEQLTGYPFAETQGRNMITQFVPKQERQRVSRLLREAIQGREARQAVAPLRTRDGSLRLIEWFAKPIANAAGEPSAVLAIGQDITERKQTEEALRRSEYHLNNFFEQAPIGLLWLSASGTILRANQAQLELMGYSEKEYLGHFFIEFCGEPVLGRELLQRLAAKETVRNLRMTRRCKDGTILQVLVDAKSLWDGKAFQYSSVFLRDITDRVRLEQEILQIGEREHRRIAQDLHDGLGQLLAGTAYLTNILRQELAAKQLPEARQSARILKVINESIALTRSLARGMHPVAPEPNGLMVALEALAERTTKMFRIHCHFRCRRPVLIHDNLVATHLFRIAQEAVTNAIKHGQPGRIEISLTELPGRIILAVRDDGAGMPARPKKPGMGLRIMRYRAGVIGGSVGIQKEAGGGTVVVCTVQTPEQAVAKPARPAVRKQKKLKKKKD